MALTDNGPVRVLQALAEPRRLRILEHLREGELTAGAIASRFDVTRPAISHHLGVLHDAGLVRVRPEGTRRLYSIRPAGFVGLREYLQDFWSERLDRLKGEVESRWRGGRT